MLENEKDKEIELEAEAENPTHVAEGEAQDDTQQETLAETETEVETETVDGGEGVDENVDGNEEFTEEAEKMLTQSQVNEIVGRVRQEARDSVLRELFNSYGVSGREELDVIFGNGQAYEGLNDEYLAQGNLYKSAMAENALLKSKADENRWEDIKLILGGKGLDITVENIESMIPSHPEWRQGQQQQVTQEAIPNEITPEVAEMVKQRAAQQPQTQQSKPVTLRKLGGEATPMSQEVFEETEEEKVRRLYGL